MLSFAGDCSGALRTINPDGSGDFPLWGTPEQDLFQPAEFSPDGNRLLFSRLINPVGALYDFDLFVLDLRNGQVTRVVQNPAQESFAAWSPDGTKIAFESNRDTPPGQWQNEIYILDLATGAQTRLTDNALYDGGLDWSPDGRYIVVARGTGSESDLIRIELATGQEVNLTQPPTSAFETFPSFSPDGQRVVFARGLGSNSFSDIYSIAIDGSDLRQLTTNSDHERFPVWSPDGARIVFSRGFGPKEDLISIGSAGGDERYITHHSGSSESHYQDCMSDWQPCVAATARCRSQAPPTAGGGPGLGPGGGGGPSPGLAPVLVNDTTKPRLRVLSRLRLSGHRRLVKVRIACSEACVARLGLRSGRRRLARAVRVRLVAAKPRTVRLRLLAKAPRRLRRMTLTAAVIDAAGNRTIVSRKIPLSRRAAG